MNSGLMDVLATVQRPTYSNSAYGKGTKPTSFTEVRRIYGRVQYNGGSETSADPKKEFRESVTITFHYVDSSDILLTDRLVFDSKNWNITSRSTINRNQYIRMEAVAVG